MEGEVKQLESRTLLLAKLASPSITQFNLDPKSQPPRPKVQPGWPSGSSRSYVGPKQGDREKEMGVWAGPDWPEAGLRTKPPGSPYLGPERRAAPRAPRAIPARRRPRPGDPRPGGGPR